MPIRRKTWLLNTVSAAFLGVCIALGGSGTGIRAQATGPAEEAVAGEPSKTELSTRRLEEFKRAASTYQMTLESVPPRPLALQAEPLLRWTNPLRKTSDGAVFLWVSEGRPVVVASFYRYGTPDALREDHEFQSLARTGITATRSGRDVWFPKTPGITLVAIPGAPAPAANPADRLRQMRALAREFKAFLDLPDQQSELRLLTKPLYRYEARDGDASDGALFAFVQTTDPEVLLLIETQSRGGALAWHYAVARMSMVNLRAEHKDQIVWRAEWDYDVTNPGKPYMTLRDTHSDGEGLNP
jgi:hypothetical protein